MKKILALIVSLTMVCSCGPACADIPDNVKDRNNNKSERNKEQAVQSVQTEANARCSPEDIWDGVDAAYAANYIKFTLPEKDTLLQEIPDGVYNAKLSYVLENDRDRFKERLTKFEEAMGAEVSGEPEYIPNDGAYLHTDENFYIILGQTGSGSISWEENSEILLPEYLTGAYVLNRNTKIDDENVLRAAQAAEEYSAKAYDALGIELESKPCDAHVYNIDGKNYYWIDSQNYYKGVGIENLCCQYSDLTATDENGRSDIYYCMSNNTQLRSDMSPISYSVSYGFKKIKEEKLDDIISFKGACDILEQELSDNIITELVFDDVKLWYEPRGESINFEKDINEIDKTVTLTPKWYFIIDNIDAPKHYIYYVTVDCQSGEIQVMLKPNGA